MTNEINIIQRALLCPYIRFLTIVDNYSGEKVKIAIDNINKDDFILDYGSQGFDVLWHGVLLDYSNTFKLYPEKWI